MYFGVFWLGYGSMNVLCCVLARLWIHECTLLCVLARLWIHECTLVCVG